MEISKNLKEKVPLDKLVFGRTFTDYMIICDWSKETGWLQPKIQPFGDLTLHPAASVLHYGLECFEGLKAYRDGEGKIRLFRPEENMRRFYESSTRLALPVQKLDNIPLISFRNLIRRNCWKLSSNGLNLRLLGSLISPGTPFTSVPR